MGKRIYQIYYEIRRALPPLMENKLRLYRWFHWLRPHTTVDLYLVDLAREAVNTIDFRWPEALISSIENISSAAFKIYDTLVAPFVNKYPWLALMRKRGLRRSRKLEAIILLAYLRKNTTDATSRLLKAITGDMKPNTVNDKYF